VPDYQRGYAWESAQVDALLEDLKVLKKSGAPTRRRHFDSGVGFSQFAYARPSEAPKIKPVFAT